MKQGYNDRLDDSMGARNGKKGQSMKSRRHESEGMEKSMGKRKFSGDMSSLCGCSTGGSLEEFKEMGTMKKSWT